jgi:[acyl-carrier-protein] S-malonyltransferase
MAMDLFSLNSRARHIIQRADECLGYSLSKIMSGHPPGDLDRTRYTQPAIFVHSVALYEEFRTRFPESPVAAAGHSLGEFSALYAAGVLDFESALRLIQVRATGMEEAQPPATCGMAALVGITPERVLELVEMHRGNNVLEVANYNAPDQIVISGHKPAVSRIVAAAGHEKRARAVMLNVASAFHTSLMEPALERLDSTLMQTPIGRPNFPVVANLDAQFYPHEGTEIRKRLINQVVRPVLWDDCVRTMLKSGAKTFIEIGPGKVLTGLLRRINRQATGINISDAQSLGCLESTLVA